jgi:hypothetical protein
MSGYVRCRPRGRLARAAWDWGSGRSKTIPSPTLSHLRADRSWLSQIPHQKAHRILTEQRWNSGMGSLPPKKMWLVLELLGFFVSVAMLCDPIWRNRPSFVSESIGLPHCSTVPDPVFIEKMTREDVFHARTPRSGSTTRVR